MAKKIRYLTGLRGAVTEFTKQELETHEAMLDRIRGGPRKKIATLAEEIGIEYEALLKAAHDYIDTKGEASLNTGTNDDFPDEFWNWFELVTGRVCPPDLRYSFFSCAC